MFNTSFGQTIQNLFSAEMTAAFGQVSPFFYPPSLHKHFRSQPLALASLHIYLIFVSAFISYVRL